MSSPATSSPLHASVNWAEVRARLDRVSAAIEARENPPEEGAEILANRARELAVPLAGAATEEVGALEVIAFELSGQVYAIATRNVRETVIPGELTRLPGLPDFVRGVVNVRSRIVAAMDLRPLFQLPPLAATQGEKLLIVEFEGAEFGVLADHLLGLRTLPGELRREVSGLNAAHLIGIAADGTLLIDLASLVPELVVDDGPEA